MRQSVAKHLRRELANYFLRKNYDTIKDIKNIPLTGYRALKRKWNLTPRTERINFFTR